MLQPVIAIDGPAASGKSTVAKLVAKKVGFVYIDTGAMYRAFAWVATEHGISPKDRAAVKNLIKQIHFDMTIDAGVLHLQIDGKDPSTHIRGAKINQTVSPLSALPELCEFLVIKQRMLRVNYPMVVEGRDIGTVVFPDTPHKFFIDADPEVRAQRRQEQGQSDQTGERDRQDRNRSVAPLICAADAESIDSGKYSAEEIATHIVAQSKAQGLHPKSGV
jgi:cytidylate kinase